MLLRATCALLSARWLAHLAARDDAMLATMLCSLGLFAPLLIGDAILIAPVHIHARATAVVGRTSDVRYEQARSSDRRYSSGMDCFDDA